MNRRALSAAFNGRRSAWAVGLAVGIGLAAAGCEPTTNKGMTYEEVAKQTKGSGAPIKPPPPIDPTLVPTRDDIVQIVQYWPQMPVLMESGRPVGIQVRAYMIDAREQKGAFVPGTVEASIYTHVRKANGVVEPTLVHTWRLDERAAMGFRMTRESTMGYSYGFVLRWPEELDIYGKLVDVVFSYARGDGRVIKGAAKRFVVPLRTGYVPPGGGS